MRLPSAVQAVVRSIGRSTRDLHRARSRRVKAEDTWKRFLKEGTVVQVVMYNGACISVEMPNSMDLEVTMTEPAVKASTRIGFLFIHAQWLPAAAG